MAEQKKCDVTGCDEPSVRSLPLSRVSPYLDVAAGGGRRGHAARRRVHLCQAHYREYKKSARKDRAIERAYWD
ncbi:MAG TPA: hypothetical protein EYP43_00490 [Thermoplasmata archaeon]|nr:hypothetical protein [Thermoplasmata archaeon]